MLYYSFFLSLISLVAGPVIYKVFKKNLGVHQFFEELNFVLIAGLVFIHILPEILNHSAYLGITYLLLGTLFPKFLDYLFKDKEDDSSKFHVSILIIGLIGIGLHTTIDGTILGGYVTSQSQSEYLLSLSILIHRFPVGLTIWFLFRPKYSLKTTIMILMFLELCTCVGFFLHDHLFTNVSAESIVLFQAFVTGSIIHMIINLSNSGVDNHKFDKHKTDKILKGIGSLLGILCLYFITVYPQTSIDHQGGILEANFSRNFLILSLKSAPILLLSYLFAGVFHVFYPEKAFFWMRKGNIVVQSSKGVLAGILNPICSCGIIPIYRSLVKKGIPTAAGVSFLIATPILGIESFLLSLSLLGFEYTLLRLVCAIIVALFIGGLIGYLYPNKHKNLEKEISKEKAHINRKNISASFKCGFYEVFDHTAPWIVLGFTIAAALEPLLRTNLFLYSSPTLSIFIFAILGLPVYFCASGATPIIAVLIMHGFSPGAGMAFLMTGPATSAAMTHVIKKLHRKRNSILFSILIFLIPILLGIITNVILQEKNISILQFKINPEQFSIFNWASLAFLSVILILSIYRQGVKGFVAEILHPLNHEAHNHNHDHCEQHTLKV